MQTTLIDSAAPANTDRGHTDDDEDEEASDEEGCGCLVYDSEIELPNRTRTVLRGKDALSSSASERSTANRRVMHDGRARFMVDATEGPEPERKVKVRATEPPDSSLFLFSILFFLFYF